MKHEFIAVLDFGGQNNQLVARRIRALNVYCEVMPHTTNLEELKAKQPLGIILTGGTGDCNDADAPQMNPEIFNLNIPVLGIGYSGSLIAKMFGGSLGSLQKENQLVETSLCPHSKLFQEAGSSLAWVGEYQHVETLPEGFKAIAKNKLDDTMALENPEKGIYTLQFHPEVTNTTNGLTILDHFVQDICGAKKDWSMADFAASSIEEIRNTVGDGKVLLALSGGVDSSVVASLIEKAVGNQLYCIFVDHGLMRYNEGDEVEAAFANSGMNFIRVNAEDRFLGRLKGVTDPETKRKIIGEEFIRVFEEEAKKIGTVDFFAQGTIYPDIIESQTESGKVVKSHHNVGGLPEHVDFKEIIEPVRLLFKDEVRRLGQELGLPEYLVSRQPFPGPGLGVRVIGELTKEKLDRLRLADFIYREEIANAGLDKEITQYFVVLTNLQSVGVTDDERTYDYTMALRAVITTDFMTAQWAEIPFPVLHKISRRIVTEVPHVNRLVYDITSKPPATIEWE